MESLNNFLLGLRYMQEFLMQANVREFPTVKVEFKNNRELAHFEAQLRMKWPRDIQHPNNLEKFQIFGITVELISLYK